MNLTSFECFICAAELMSFTRAAETLFISQQSVSMHIKRLEDEYQVKLFERKPALKLTPAGETFLQFARDIVAADQKLSDQLSAINDDYHGTINIGLPVNRTYAFARKFVPKFTEQFPNMSVSLYEKPSPALLDAVQRNDVDVAMAFAQPHAPNLDPLVFNYKSLGYEPLYAIISDNLLKQYFPDDYQLRKMEYSEGLNLEDIAQLPLFIRPSSSKIHFRVMEYLRARKLKPNILVQTTSTSAMMPLCVRGYGVIFCTPMLLDMFREDYSSYMDNLNLFPINGFEKAQHALLVWAKNKYITTPMRASMQYIEEMFEDIKKIR